MDTVESDNLKFTVLSVEDKRIAKVRIDITPRDAEAADSEDESAERRSILIHKDKKNKQDDK